MINSAWSLRSEMFFYCIFGFLMIFGRKFFWIFMTLGIVVIVLVNSMSFIEKGIERYMFSKWNLLFISGCILAELEPLFRKRAKAVFIISILIILSCVLLQICLGLPPSHKEKSLIENIISSICFSSLIATCCTMDYFKWKPPSILLLLGNASYCIYLLHGSILFHLRKNIESSSILCGASWAAFLLILLASCFIYKFYEKPVNDFLRRKFC